MSTYCNINDVNKKFKKISVSTCLFKLKSNPYKDFSEYINGLKNLYSLSKKYDVSLILFTDDSILNDKDIIDDLNKMEDLIIFYYDCNLLKLDEKYHMHFLGTLMRFLPLFDYPSNKTEYVLICDADYDKKQMYLELQLELLKKLIEIKLDKSLHFFFSGRVYQKNAKKTMFPYCIAANIIGLKKLPHEIFDNFFKKLIKYMKPNIYSKITSYHLDQVNEKNVCNNNVCYGLDEYFINSVLIPTMAKKKYAFGYRTTFNILQYLYYLDPKTNPKLKGKEKTIKMYIDKLNIDKKIFNIINKYNKAIYLKKMSFEEKNIVNLYGRKMIDLILEFNKTKNYKIFEKQEINNMLNINYNKYIYAIYFKFVNCNIQTYIYDYLEY